MLFAYCGEKQCTMNEILAFMFPYKPYALIVSAQLLVLRLFFGGMIMWHGIGKIVNFETLVTTFPNPIHLGHRFSLIMAIFAEAFCGLAVVAGAFYRLALIPLIFTMVIALLVVHHGQAFAHKELALIYLVMFVLMYVMGAGGFSLDDLIAQRLHQDNQISSAG